MDIHSALDWRYAVREFSPEKLDTKIVENLLDATRKVLPPTAFSLTK